MLKIGLARWVIGACLLLGMGGASAAPTAEQMQMLQQLTPDQLQQIQQMSPEQRSALMKGAGGVTSGAALPSANAPVSNPEVVKQTAPVSGRLEQDVKTASVDGGKADAEVKASAQSYVPVDKVKNQQAAEKDEVRKAFADYLKESKPLVVNTDGLKQFGYELFSGAPTTFAPATDVPVPPEYVLGPGDEIKVQMFGKDSQVFTLTVDREGAVAFPQIGPIQIAGMSFADAKALLADEIKQKMIGVSVSITMGQLRSIRVFALGDVSHPGSYTVSGLATLSHALLVSGGVKTMGSLRNIELKRSGRRIVSMDLYDFLLRGDTSRDVRLLPGDVVFSPPIGQTVSIAGEVVRPAIYEIKNERTVGDILKLAGGLMPKAYVDKGLIERIDSHGETQVINIGLNAAGLNTPVRNGDVIKVFAGSEFESNQVLLIGNLKRPGKRAYEAGMHVSSLVSSMDDLLPETFLDYGVIEREAADTREPMLIRFHLSKIVQASGKGGEYDLSLQPRDRVYVFHRANFRQQPTVKISGSVQTPGEYEFKRNMRLADLVLAAGGMIRDTDTDAVEVFRVQENTRDVRLIKVSLKLAMQGDSTSDIELQDQDKVIVHSVYERKNKDTVSVIGEVHHSGQFQLASGMRVADLVYAGGNVTDAAYLARAEITRRQVEGGEERVLSHIEIDLAAALRRDEKSNVLLEPYDVLTVRKIANWRETESVKVEGEVAHPGEYQIEEGELLSSFLRRVGGYTKDAYLPAAVFTRESVRAEQQEQLNALVKRLESELAVKQDSVNSLRDESLKLHQTQALSTATQMVSTLKSTSALGRLELALADADKLAGTPSDIRLRAGDKLIIPKRPDQVMVVGEVYSQTAALYNPSYARSDYVAQAGLTRMADESAIYVVRANGRVEAANGWMSSSGKIGPGDTIIVPTDLDHVNMLDIALDWSRAMMQIGTSVAAMKAIGVFK
ncbi:MAG: SLBB domain-containing protein [Nitrosomonadales bacterium]|nr:SLBB domain-containing protein [Nitrosomonadales bacterium]